MEYCEHGNLNDYLRSISDTEEDKILEFSSFVYQITSGQYLSTSGLVQIQNFIYIRFRPRSSTSIQMSASRFGHPKYFAGELIRQPGLILCDHLLNESILGIKYEGENRRFWSESIW